MLFHGYGVFILKFTGVVDSIFHGEKGKIMGSVKAKLDKTKHKDIEEIMHFSWPAIEPGYIPAVGDKVKIEAQAYYKDKRFFVIKLMIDLEMDIER